MINTKLLEMLKYESSDISWCESKYVYSKYICEFFNTITGIPYIILGFYGLYQFNKLTKNKNNLFNITYNTIDQFEYYKMTYKICIFIGLFTMYFHGTLSYVGQLCDEISILIFISVLNTTPEYNPLILLLELPFIIYLPNLNRYFLLLFSLLRSKNVYLCYNKLQNNEIKKVLIRSLYLFAASIFFWIFDMFYCKYLYISLHWLWHISSSYAMYYLINFMICINLNNPYDIKIKYKYFIPHIEHKKYIYN